MRKGRRKKGGWKCEEKGVVVYTGRRVLLISTLATGSGISVLKGRKNERPVGEDELKAVRLSSQQPPPPDREVPWPWPRSQSPLGL